MLLLVIYNTYYHNPLYISIVGVQQIGFANETPGCLCTQSICLKSVKMIKIDCIRNSIGVVKKSVFPDWPIFYRLLRIRRKPWISRACIFLFDQLPPTRSYFLLFRFISYFLFSYLFFIFGGIFLSFFLVRGFFFLVSVESLDISSNFNDRDPSSILGRFYVLVPCQWQSAFSIFLHCNCCRRISCCSHPPRPFLVFLSTHSALGLWFRPLTSRRVTDGHKAGFCLGLSGNHPGPWVGDRFLPGDVLVWMGPTKSSPSPWRAVGGSPAPKKCQIFPIFAPIFWGPSGPPSP